MKNAIRTRIYNERYRDVMSFQDFEKEIEHGLLLMNAPSENLSAENFKSLNLAIEYTNALLGEALIHMQTAADSEDVFPTRYTIVP